MTPLRIAVVGAGRMGCGLAGRWTEAGHDVTLCFVRDAERLRRRAEAVGARHGDVGHAVAAADAVLLSPPWPAVGTALDQARSLAGKVVLDCVNPVGEDVHEFFPAGSAAERTAAQEPLARIVKAFNLLPARALESGSGAVVRYCGDDAEALSVARRLIVDAGFTPRASGGLHAARRLERRALEEIRRERTAGRRQSRSPQLALSSWR